MKTNIFIFTAAMAATFFCAYHAQGQTYGAGNMGANCGVGTSGGNNVVFIGCSAGNANTATGGNTFIGNSAGTANTLGRNNVFVGWHAANVNTTAHYNVAVGDEALGSQSYSVTIGFDSYNVAVGYRALYSNAPSSTTTGIKNTALGHQAGFSNSTGIENVFQGYQAGYSNTTGGKNLFSGFEAGFSNTTASENVFAGYRAGFSNTTGTANDYSGFESGYYNQTGNNNTMSGYQAGGRGNLAAGSFSNNCFFGYRAGYNMEAQSDNVAIGVSALQAQTFGTAFSSQNTAVGNSALLNTNPTATSNGFRNTAVGFFAGRDNTTGNQNTFLGFDAGMQNTTAIRNTYVGYQAGYLGLTSAENVCVGYAAGYNNTGSNNVLVGNNAGQAYASYTTCTFVGNGADANATSYSNASAIGNGAIVNASNKVRFGNAAVTVVEGPVAYTVSDARFKTNVTESVKGLEFIKKLRPVNYKLDAKAFDDFVIKNMPDSIKVKHQLGMDFTGASSLVHSGFIAQEVELSAQQCGFTTDIVHTPVDGNDNYSIAYGAIVVPLVKAVQELSKKQDSLIAVIATLTGTGQRIQNENGNSSIETDVTLANRKVVLDQNSPNPFKEQTTITYEIKTDFNSAMIMFTDMRGEVIKEVPITIKGKGQLNVFASDLSSGIYTYYIVVDGKTITTKKMVKE